MFVIMILSLILYAIAIAIIYPNLYGMDKPQKIKFMAIGIGVIIVVTIVLCSISSSQIIIENKGITGITRNVAILIFAPINTMILLPFLGSSLNQYKEKQIVQHQMKKRMFIEIVLLLVVIIIEIGYIKNFQLGLLNSVIHRS